MNRRDRSTGKGVEQQQEEAGGQGSGVEIGTSALTIETKRSSQHFHLASPYQVMSPARDDATNKAGEGEEGGVDGGEEGEGGQLAVPIIVFPCAPFGLTVF